MKVGDRVEVRDDFQYSSCSFKMGEQGVICKFNSDVGVYWDCGQDKMHNCDGACEQGFGYFVPECNLQVVRKDEKMDEPKTQLEKTACKDAIKESIEAQVRNKKVVYTNRLVDFISYEKKAQDYRNRANELKKSLNLTEAEIKQMI